jgi:hypothetical protein
MVSMYNAQDIDMKRADEQLRGTCRERFTPEQVIVVTIGLLSSLLLAASQSLSLIIVVRFLAEADSALSAWLPCLRAV